MNVGVKLNFRKILEKAKTEKKVISVFSNLDDVYKAGVGYVLEIDKDFFVMENISDTGTYAGYSLKRHEHIFRIDMECEYEQRYRKVYESSPCQHLILKKTSENLLVDFFKMTMEHTFIVAMGVNDFQVSVRGFVQDIDTKNKILTLAEITDNGEKTGNIYIAFDSIFRANADEETNQFLKTLYELSN